MAETEQTWRETNCPTCMYYKSCKSHWEKFPSDPNKKCYGRREKV